MEIQMHLFEGAFHELCKNARMQKKPILIMMLRDNSQETYQFTRQALSDSTVQELVEQSFLAYGMYRNNVNPHLSETLVFPQNSMLSLWMLSVQP